MKDSTVFDSFYSKLNPRQQEAVDTVEGPVMVVAGPGTGKTQILTLRIANILRITDTSPDSILALTFTESAVHSMRRRLTEIIGSSAYRVTIATFHGFANDLIKRYPEVFPRIIGATNMSDVEQVSLIKELIETGLYPKITPYGDRYYYVHPVMKEIKEMKREAITADELKERLRRTESDLLSAPDLYHDKGKFAGAMRGVYGEELKQIEKGKELAELYTQYELTLRERKLYDYEDMIVEVVKVMESDRDFRLTLQEQYQYLLADEHQDANNAQNRVLESLADYHENPNIFIVGDEKQAIFRFQGASLNNFLRFTRLFPKAKVIFLEDNYRSTQLILDAAHTLASRFGVTARSVRLNAFSGEGKKRLRIVEANDEREELLFVAKEIEKRVEEEKLESGDDAFPNIAVLYRDNADAFPLSGLMTRLGIPHLIESNENVMGNTYVRAMIMLLKATHNLDDDSALAETMFLDFLKIHPFDVATLIEIADAEKISLSKLIFSKQFSTSKLLDSEPIMNFAKMLVSWRKFIARRTLPELFEKVFHESGLANSLMSSDSPMASLEYLSAFFHEVQGVGERHKEHRLEDLLNYLETIEKQKVTIKRNAPRIATRGVRLMTAHRAKGMEFDIVYIIGAHYGHWGDKHRRSLFHLPLDHVAPAEDNDTANDDERRLFYVALTRARHEVIITYALRDAEGKERLPSRFIEEIDPALVEREVATTKDDQNNLPFFAITPTFAKSDPRLTDNNYLRELFLRRGLSVTGLNNYLECPWRYFYSNLLRLPQGKSKHQMFGSAVHSALADFYTRLAKGEKADEHFLVASFEEGLNRSSIAKRDYEETLKKGQEALGGYYENYKKQIYSRALVEFAIRGVSFGEATLNGILDKVEILSDNFEVNVVDYKTGSPKSRNDIEGNTKTSNGNYKRQLVFYKLLLDRFADGKYKMSSGEIDFVEPNDSGKYKKEKFIITNDEVRELEILTEQVIKGIMSLSFWDTRCSDPDCSFCHLRNMMG